MRFKIFTILYIRWYSFIVKQLKRSKMLLNLTLDFKIFLIVMLKTTIWNSSVMCKPQLLFPDSSSELYEGSRCSLAANRSVRSSCVPTRKCVYAQQIIRNGGRPQICSFEGFASIVCCPLSSSNTSGGTEDNERSKESLESEDCSTDNGGCSKPNERIVTTEPNRYVSGKRPANEHCDLYHPKREGIWLMVVGGEPALPKQFPHMAAVGFGDESNIQWLCGGALISERYVLTAAHCLDSEEHGPARWVRLGDLDVRNTTDDARPQQFRVDRNVAHPEYRSWSHYNDIGLLRLAGKPTFDDYVQPACLHSGRLEDPSAVAIGWGKTSFAGATSDVLRKVTLNIVSATVCQQSYQRVATRRLANGIQDGSQICAAEEGKDTCQGDSGGPLQVKKYRERGVYMLIGVTSFGRACGLANAPGVYTRVAHYVDWIESVVWPESPGRIV